MTLELRIQEIIKVIDRFPLVQRIRKGINLLWNKLVADDQTKQGVEEKPDTGLSPPDLGISVLENINMRDIFG